MKLGEILVKHLFDDPVPKVRPDFPSQIEWKIHSKLLCGGAEAMLFANFDDLALRRRSEREMKSSSLRKISNVLAFALGPRFIKNDDAYQRIKAVCMSAGALHSVEVLIVDWRGATRIFRYNRMLNQLELLKIGNPDRAQEFIDHFLKLLPHGPKTALVMVGDLKKISAVYEHPHTLLFRDSGAISQGIAMATTAFDLSFCPLGILGSEIIEALGLDRSDAIAVGCAAIGQSAA